MAKAVRKFSYHQFSSRSIYQMPVPGGLWGRSGDDSGRGLCPHGANGTPGVQALCASHGSREGASDGAPTYRGGGAGGDRMQRGSGCRGSGRMGHRCPRTTVAGRTKPESSSKIDAPLINGPSRNPCCTFQIPRDAWDLPPSDGFVSSENSEQLLCVLRLSSGPGYCPIICLILILPIFLTFFSPLTYFSEGVSVADTDARTPPPAVSCVLGQQPPALRVEAASSLRSRGCSSRGSCSQIANTATVQGLASLPTAESLLRKPLGRDSVDSES